jgi:curved DNA-binding protein CbpA
MSIEEGAPDLLVIDEAFGPSADLYVDVLGVQPNASPGQIQHSYFDRREELFRLLNEIDGDQEQDSITASHRFHAERKLDGVVVAMRILGDPKLRLQYDDMRYERMQGAPVDSGHSRELGRKLKSQARIQANSRSASNKTTIAGAGRSLESRAEEDFPQALEDIPLRQRTSPPRTRLRSGSSTRRNKENKEAVEAVSVALNFSMDSTPSDEGGRKIKNDEAGGNSRRKNKVKARVAVVSPDQEMTTRQKKKQAKMAKKERTQMDKESLLDTSFDDTLDTTFTFDEEKTALTFASQGTLATHVTETKFINQIATEITGTFEDTQAAFEQVFSVFTLRDEDIRAVTGKIDKAKREIERNLNPVQR